MYTQTKLESIKNSRRFAFGVFLLPGVVVFALLILYPIFSSFTYSLYSWDGLIREDFVGFGHFYTILFSDHPISTRFWNAASNNAYALVFVLVIQTSLGFLVALMLFQGLPGTKFFRALVFLPVTLSIVVVGFLFRMFLHPTWGIVNHFIELFVEGSFNFPWLGDPATAFTTILLVNVWRWAGFPALIFLAGLNNIPGSIIDACEMDGVRGFTRAFRIYLPLIVPQLLTVLILTITGNLRMFDIVFALTGPMGSPNYATDVFGTLFYRSAFGTVTGLSNKGIGATIGILLVIISAVLSIIVTRALQNKRVELEG